MESAGNENHSFEQVFSSKYENRMTSGLARSSEEDTPFYIDSVNENNSSDESDLENGSDDDSESDSSEENGSGSGSKNGSDVWLLLCDLNEILANRKM